MKRTFSLAFAMFLLLTACVLPPTSTLVSNADDHQSQRVVFAPAVEDIPNPERGFFQVVELGETDLNRYPEQTANRLLYLSARLDDYRNRDLSSAYLATLNNFFLLARQAGLKLIVRFAYNDGETYPDPAPDAPLPQVLRHIAQLAPVLTANQDVIAWFEAGFIGAWGEWHTSANSLDSAENRVVIRDALYRHFPPDRFILFRYPGDLVRWYPQPLNAAQAFTGSDQARTGHHNDCFLAGEDDRGTYLADDGSFKGDEWKTYLASMTRFVPMSGETCAPSPPRSDCPTALLELERLHWTALNEAYHPEVIRTWRTQGCYAEIRRRLGYRLSLLEATFPKEIRLGESLNVHVRLSNSGFASPLLPRPVYLVLTGKDARMHSLLEIDPRRWQPGEHEITVSLTIPTGLPPGEYKLALWLADPAIGLQHDPRYAIRFANEGIWDHEFGWNVLGTLTVTEVSEPVESR